MLIDDLHEQLKNMAPDIQTIVSFWNNTELEKQFEAAESTSQEEDFWKNPRQTEISKELQQLRTLRNEFMHIIATHKDLTELIDLFAENESELIKITRDVNDLRKKVIAFKIH